MRHIRLFIPLVLAFASLSLGACDGDDETGSGGSDPSGTGGSGGRGGTGGAGGAGGAGGGMQADIFEQLQALPGVEVEELPSEIDGYRYFELEIEQPADHANPGGQKFKQRATLHHRDLDAPVVLQSTGYVLWSRLYDSQYIDEPTMLLAGNQISLEHRFFEPSRPEPADWTQLTIEQAAADTHRVVEILRPIYGAKWVSTGASKGGMTSVYHRRFYPGDVDATVAYVAPLNLSRYDPRYVEFLHQVGDATCRQRLRDFQREVLLRRTEMETRIQEEGDQLGITYDFYGVDGVLESTALSFSFRFWAYYGADRCDDIPTAASTDDEVWSFFTEVGSPSSRSSDEWSLLFEPYYWQAATQLGSQMSDYMHLYGLLVYDWSQLDLYPSVDMNPNYDPAVMQDIHTWVTTEAERILFIYGENDPFSAAAFELGNAQDSHRLYVPGGNHGAVIASLTPADRQIALDALAAWTGVTPLAPESLAPSSSSALPMRLQRPLELR